MERPPFLVTFVKRIKFLGIFLVPLGFFLETPLRYFFKFIAELFLNIFKEGFIGGPAGITIKEILIQGSPTFFIYFPALIGLIILIQDGFQGFDWVWGPLFLGFLLKGAILGSISIAKQGGEFWRMYQVGVPLFLLKFFIFVFVAISIWSIIVWIKDLIES